MNNSPLIWTRICLIALFCVQPMIGAFSMEAIMPKKIKLTQGKFAIVDDDDFSELNKFKWFSTKHSNNYYCARKIKTKTGRKNLSMHRHILNATSGFVVDHINHDTLDNRKCNLRMCTMSENGMNRKVSKMNTSGITGISWSRKNNKWHVTIACKKTNIFLGLFDEIKDAIIARKEAEIKYFGEFRYKKTSRLTQ